MAVVFPAPAGAIASCSRAPDVHIWRTRKACPASSAAVRRHLKQGQLHRRLLDGRTAALSGGCDEASLGVEDSRRRVEGGAGDGVDRRPVEPPQHLRFLDVIIRQGQRHGSRVQHLIDQQVYQCRGMFSRPADDADLSLRFGPTCHICHVSSMTAKT